jgi:hypothetical protein
MCISFLLRSLCGQGWGALRAHPPVWRMTSCAGFHDVAMLLVREPQLRVLVALVCTLAALIPHSLSLSYRVMSTIANTIFADALHPPPVRRPCWWPTLVVLLLRRRGGRRAFYLGPHRPRPVVPLRPFVPHLPPPPPSTHIPRQIATRRVTARMFPPCTAHSAPRRACVAVHEPGGIRTRRLDEFEIVSRHGHGHRYASMTEDDFVYPPSSRPPHATNRSDDSRP